jgi:hypothetical protein
MAEALCNNPAAMITPRGLTPEKPCGFWEAEGLGWCNDKDLNDWIAVYRTRIDAAKSQMRDLEKLKKIKLLDLSPEEALAKAEIAEHELIFKAIQEASYKGEKLTSQQTSKKISDILVQAQNLNCMIENVIQAGIEELGGTLRPTGLIAGSRTSGNTGTYVGWGLAALLGFYAYNKLA